jgi:hypothetical protein
VVRIRQSAWQPRNPGARLRIQDLAETLGLLLADQDAPVGYRHGSNVAINLDLEARAAIRT